MIELLFAFALEATDYKIHCLSREFCPIPVVEIKPLKEKDMGPLLGLYKYTEPLKLGVSYDNDPGGIYWQATVLHEFVHYLQWRAGKLSPKTTCEEKVELEKEAYKIETKFLQTHGIEADFYEQVFIISMGCHAY